MGSTTESYRTNQIRSLSDRYPTCVVLLMCGITYGTCYDEAKETKRSMSRAKRPGVMTKLHCYDLTKILVCTVQTSAVPYRILATCLNHGNWLVTLTGHPYYSMAIIRLISDIQHLIDT